MKILIVGLLFLVVAQLPSCGVGSQEFVGFVDDKLIETFEGRPHPTIYIGATAYEISWEFYRQVCINDLVKYQNGKWTIVKPTTRPCS